METESRRFDLFILALRALCLEHEVQIAASDYDSLQVWCLEPGGELIHFSDIEDRTGGAAPARTR